nr:GntR family transcriptional regulator [uncultured Shuttleworthia sp.]
MQFDSSIPIYLQVSEAIKQDIVAGRRLPGDKLPSGRELALLYRINPNTAARVYQVLESEGVCISRRGLGTFVREDGDLAERIRREMAEENIDRFVSGMREMGFGKEEILAMVKEAL